MKEEPGAKPLALVGEYSILWGAIVHDGIMVPALLYTEKIYMEGNEEGAKRGYITPHVPVWQLEAMALVKLQRGGEV